jgi:glycosyltransferase involved in cell wall biosynthesis
LYREYAYKSYGILNGIDTQVWDPREDKALTSKLEGDSWTRFKQLNKEAVCKANGLDPNLPLCVFIGRLATEKGGDLIVPAVGEFVHQTKAMNFYLLGSGAKQVENQFRHISSVFPQHVVNYIGYNESLAHQLYAAADFLLMPSLVEPCGLNQLYARLQEVVSKDKVSNDVIITNLRHYQALSEAAQALEQVLQSMQQNRKTELLAFDIRKAIFHLGEITGEITNDDLLANIFSKFCIGK